MMEIRLKEFFDKYDELGNFHNGFLQSIDITDYTDITFLNEVTLNIMDSFIKNEIGNIVTMNKWNCFLQWDKTKKKYKIKSDFYNSALDSIYVYLLRSQKFFELTQVDFKSFSATETEQIIYGAKETEKNYDKVLVTIKRGNDTTNYGQEQKTNVYGQLETTLDYDSIARTLNYGAISRTLNYDDIARTLNYGATQKTNVYGARNETSTTGQQVNTSDTVHQKHPYDMNTFLDDTKDTTNSTNGSRQDTRQETSRTDTESSTTHSDTDNTASRTDTDTTATHSDSDTTASRTDTETTATHTDTETTASKTDTNTYGDVTNDTASRTDTDTIKTHTDTKTRTKIIILSPDKYFMIQKELLKYNVYDLLLASVKDCFTTKSF